MTTLFHFRRFLCLAGGLLALAPILRAETPPLVARAFAHWSEGHEDLAFTQQTKFLLDDGSVKEERVERYDPSLPDSQRWHLLEVDGRPATEQQRQKIEIPKNAKARKKVVKTPSEYLDFEHASLLDETPATARYELNLRPEAARLLAVEKIAVAITIDKKTAHIAHIAATLRQPIRVLLGLARITDLDLDVGVEPDHGTPAQKPGDVKTGSTAHVSMSKLGNPLEYNWSDFKRVKSFAGPAAPTGR